MILALSIDFIILISFQVYFSRDALAKHIYSQLFLWIVTELNKSLSSTTKMFKFIGVLDIYGWALLFINLLAGHELHIGLFG